MKNLWWRWSLRSQLTLGLLGSMLLLGAAIILALFLFFERFQQHLTQQALNVSNERLLTALVLQDGQPEIDLGRLDSAYQRPLSGEYFVVRAGTSEWRSRSLWDYELPAVKIAQDGGFQRINGPAEQRLLLQSRGYQRFGYAIEVVVASNYAPLQAEFRRALWQFTGVWLIALLLTLLLMQWYLRRALAPLQRARDQLQDVRAGREALLDTQVPAELAPLILQINGLLEQTRGSLQRSRTALGNFSHALKTPLAVLASLVAREELRVHPRLQAQLREQVEHIAARVRRELAQAQTAADSQAFEPFVPERDLRQLVAALAKAHGRTLAVEWDIAQADTVGLDRSDLLEIFGNALDNAWKWAHSKVRIRIYPRPEHWCLEVEDDGPGIDDAVDQQRALQRGSRLDESMAGQGLGLAIIADTVQAYGGELDLSRSALGGLALRVTLPRLMTNPD